MKIPRLTANYYTRILLLLLFFSIMPLVVSGVLNYGIAKIYLNDSVKRRAEGDARQTKAGLEAILEQYVKAIDILNNDEDIHNLLLRQREEDYYKANYKLALIVGGNKKLVNAHVVSAYSRIHATTSEVPREFDVQYQSGWGLFRKADATSKAIVHVNDGMLRNASGAVISVAKAVRGGGRTLGYIVIGIARDSLDALLSEHRSNTYIVDAHNYVVFSSRGTAFEGLNLLPFSLEEARADSLEKKVWNASLGEETLIVSLPLAAYGLSVVNEIPLEPIARDAGTIRDTYTVVILIMLLLCPIAAVFAAKNVSAPIRKMTRLMKQVEGGDFKVRSDFKKNDEIGIMGRAFDHMTEQIDVLVRKVEEEQRSLSIAELKALQAQINPHFLYNTLDLIKYKALLGETEDVARISTSLGRMLRYLASIKDDMVTVAFEMEFINQYLSIQKKRYGERLHLLTDISPEVMAEKIPKLLLQPAVENAVIHGLENKLDGGELTIRARREGTYLVFTISDNGSGIDPQRLEQLRRERVNGVNRIGLNNIDVRARLYGDEHCGIRLQSEKGVGTSVTITILLSGRGDLK